MSEEFSEQFLTECRTYLSEPKASLAKCGKAVDLAPNSFLHKMRQAYQRGFIVLRSFENRDLAIELEEYWRNHGKHLRAFVATGLPDDLTFARSAAERLLELLRPLLSDKAPGEVNIGIISGSSTGLVIEQLVEGRLWDELMSTVRVENKRINVMALNVTPVDGWELEGNANVAVLRLAVLLRERLQPGSCEVTPYGLSSPLVIAEGDLARVDRSPSNRKVLEIADPERLDLPQPSRLNLVITGVGSPENSVFQTVREEERIPAPPDMVGDVAFAPVDENGAEVTMSRELTADGRGRKEGQKTERCIMYSVVGLKTLRRLAETGAKVMLIARNRRRGKEVTKTAAILAAIRGGYVNDVVTDEPTAKQVMLPVAT